MRTVLDLWNDSDESFASVYDREFQARAATNVTFEVETVQGMDERSRMFQRDQYHAGLTAVKKACRDSFHMLGYLAGSYLEQRKPIRCFPESRQEYFFDEKNMSAPVFLDFIEQVQVDDGEWHAPNPKRYECAYQEIKSCVERKSTFFYCLGYVLLFVVFAALVWWSLSEVLTIMRLAFHFNLWEPFPVLERVPFFAPLSSWLLAPSARIDLPALAGIVLFTVLLLWSALMTLHSLFFILIGFDLRGEKDRLREYCRLVEERAVDEYRFARFCQLWCQAEGREVPEVFPACMEDAKQAIERREHILARWPELAQPAKAKA